MIYITLSYFDCFLFVLTKDLYQERQSLRIFNNIFVQLLVANISIKMEE